jgi:DNA-binding NarL/FixJ family response regulator
MAWTVLVVDDHPEFRALARAVLEADGFAVVGEAVDGAAAIAQALELRPHVVLVDVQLPDIDGFEVARRLQDFEDPPRVILTSVRGRSFYRRRLLEDGAPAFVAKSELSGQALERLIA